jgi:branched-chain amino acid transport system substrate-binding protein
MKPWSHVGAIVTALLCGVLIIGLSAGAFVSSPLAANAQSGTLDIGAILPLTGDGADYGPGMQMAMSIAVNEVNNAGGVLGQQIRMHFEDDATNPDQGVRAAHKLIDIQHVKAILGTWASSVTLAVAPLTMKANIIEMNVSGNPLISTLEPPGQRTVFRVNATDAALASTVAQALRSQGYKTVTILTNNAAGTIGFAQVFQKSFKDSGGTVADYIEYPDKQADYTSQVQQAVKTNPSLYLLSCYTPDGTVILKQAYQLGAKAKWALPLWCLNDQLIKAVGPDAVNGDIGFDLVPSTASPAYDRLNSAYRVKTGKTAFDNVYAVHVYDAVNLLALAIVKAGTTDGHEVGQALMAISNPPGTVVTSFAAGVKLLKANQAIHYEGASGPIEFDPSGDMAPNVGMFVVTNGAPELKSTFAPGK